MDVQLIIESILFLLLFWSMVMLNSRTAKLEAALAANDDVIGGVETLLATLAQELKDAQGDDDAIEDVYNKMVAQGTRLGAAIANNTPAAPVVASSAAAPSTSGSGTSG